MNENINVENESVDTGNDETLLLVKGSSGDKSKDKENVKKLANAVSQVYYKHGIAKMRCVGAAAINNAVKAFIIAKDEAHRRGEILLLDPSFTTVSFQGQEKTGILMEVVSGKK